ncbi:MULTISPECIES: FecR family protein [unclassified Sphingobacterium]|uniref:FecR family protein n=1 Tax=unclassified Sphingobacterium TaxID=2609468 RepID=UPI0025E9DE7A|nr:MULTISPECIES: FecR family protein [unclassified Sphingobacterium]
MNISKELINKFLKGQCTPEEHAFVQTYLAEHSDEASAFFPEEEWEEWSEDKSYDESRQEDLFQLIVQQLQEEETQPRLYLSFLYRVAAAAVLLLVCALGERATRHDQSPLITGIQREVPTLYRINASNEPMNIVMSDSSSVLLYPNAELRYAENFKWKNKREVWLIGKAKFSVHKDKTKPFMVYSDRLVTTALGTQFIVDAPRQGKQVAIRLIEGSIRVEDYEKNKNGQYISQILKPGEEVNIRLSTLSLLAEAPTKAPVQDKNGAGMEAKPEGLAFKNKKLTEVFREIDRAYGTDTRWTIAGIEKLHFSGKYDRNSDNYRVILNDIAVLHHLSLKIDDNGKGAQLKQEINKSE